MFLFTNIDQVPNEAIGVKIQRTPSPKEVDKVVLAEMPKCKFQN